MSRRSIRAGVAVLAALLLAGCSSDPLADLNSEGSDKGYIAGDGTVQTFEPEAREEPVEFSGTTDEDEEFDSSDELGEVVVVNFWYAQCPPCRAEARDLEALSERFEADGVQFVGVNTRDEAGTARSFATEFGVSYPSILDYQDAGVQLAFSSNIPPNAVPTTLVLDREGRVAARILGQVTEPSILDTIIRDTVAEPS